MVTIVKRRVEDTLATRNTLFSLLMALLLLIPEPKKIWGEGEKIQTDGPQEKVFQAQDKDYLIKLEAHLLWEQLQKKEVDFEYVAELVYLLGKFDFPIQGYKYFSLLKERKPELIKIYNLEKIGQQAARKVAREGLTRASQLKKEGRLLQSIEMYFKALVIDKNILQESSDPTLLGFCIQFLDKIRTENPRDLKGKLTQMLGYFLELNGNIPDAISMYKWALTKPDLGPKDKTQVEHRIKWLLAHLPKPSPQSASGAPLPAQIPKPNNPTLVLSDAMPGELVFQESVNLTKVEKLNFSQNGFALSLSSENTRAEIPSENFQQFTLLMGLKELSKEYFFDAAHQIGDPFQTQTLIKHSDGKIHYFVKIQSFETIEKKIPNLFGDKLLQLILFERVDLEIKIFVEK